MRARRCSGGRRLGRKGNYSALGGFPRTRRKHRGSGAARDIRGGGITCGPVRYVTSQPWPFGGSQLMIACIAEAEGMELTLDTNELEDAKWVSKEEARAALDDAPDKVFSAPPPFAIANSLLKHWAWH
jgi:NAD+ diphosphatase